MKKQNRYPLEKKIKYLLDDFVSKGFWAQIAVLAGTAILLTLLFGVVAWKLGEPSYTEGYWASLMHMIDQGTITGDEVGTDSYFLFMLFVTFIGMAFTGTIIAIMNTSIQNRLDDLKKGHSAVIERNHVVVLGFDANAYTICREIAEGSRAEGKKVCMVVADSYPKEEMELASRQYNGGSAQYYEKHARTERKELKFKVIYRSGDPFSENTLSICNVQKAKAIVINREDDFETIRILLAVSSYLKKHGAYINDPKMPSVVAVIHDAENVTAAKAAAGIAPDDTAAKKAKNEHSLRILHSREILGRLLVLACIEREIPFVIDGLFNYNGSSIHIEDKTERKRNEKEWPIGTAFSKIKLNDGIPLGILCENPEQNKNVQLCPRENAELQAEDSLIYLSEDTLLKPGKEEFPEPVGSAAVKKKNASEEKRNFLLIGNSEAFPLLLGSLNGYFGKNAGICTIVSELKEAQESGGPAGKVREYRCEDPYRWSLVKKILEEEENWFKEGDPGRLTNIVLLTGEDTDKFEADKKIMLLHLNLKQFLEEHGASDISIVARMNFPQNQLLLHEHAGNDFVVGAEILNRLVTQIADDPREYDVLEDLLKQRSGNIEICSLDDYVDTEKDFNFAFVFRCVEASKKEDGKQRLPVGWIIPGREEITEESITEIAPLLVLNPTRKDLEAIQTGRKGKNCKLIVLSANES